MPYSFVHDVPITEEMYREVKAALGSQVPDGLVAHIVIRRDGGLRYIDVWDSEEQWQHFQAEKVNPAVNRMLATHGITPDQPIPHETVDVIDAWVA